MKALIVGIDSYRYLKQLTTCVNDANDWHSLLTDNLKYNSSDITVLTTVRETMKENILAGFAKFTKDLKENETGYFVYSSHGGIFRISKNDQVYLEEGLYCADGEIYESELQKLIEKNLDESTRLVSILDTCHSGGIDILAFFQHFLRVGSLLPNTNLEIKTPYADFTPANNQMAKPLLEPKRTNSITFSACRRNELAYGDLIDQRRNGLFSHHLLKILRENISITFEDLCISVKKRLPTATYNQNPNLIISNKLKKDKIFNP